MPHVNLDITLYKKCIFSSRLAKDYITIDIICVLKLPLSEH